MCGFSLSFLRISCRSHLDINSCYWLKEGLEGKTKEAWTELNMKGRKSGENRVKKNDELAKTMNQRVFSLTRETKES